MALECVYQRVRRLHARVPDLPKSEDVDVHGVPVRISTANHSLPLVMASLVVAAIPTLLVFIFCQNIILRGIVIPTFK